MDAADLLQWVAIAVLGVVGHRLALRYTRQADPTGGCGSGPRRGEPLPRAALRHAKGLLRETASGFAMAFIREGCDLCARLLSILADTGNQHLLDRVIVVTRDPSSAFIASIRDIGVRMVIDDGRLWAGCAVAETPSVVWVNSAGIVVDKEITERIDRFVGRMEA